MFGKPGAGTVRAAGRGVDTLLRPAPRAEEGRAQEGLPRLHGQIHSLVSIRPRDLAAAGDTAS